jgi:hypothetical protein
MPLCCAVLRCAVRSGPPTQRSRPPPPARHPGPPPSGCRSLDWQGARLTAYELAHDGLPATLICDSAAAALMAAGRVDAVVVGADRIAANGDTGALRGALVGLDGLGWVADCRSVGPGWVGVRDMACGPLMPDPRRFRAPACSAAAARRLRAALCSAPCSSAPPSAVLHIPPPPHPRAPQPTRLARTATL